MFSLGFLRFNLFKDFSDWPNLVMDFEHGTFLIRIRVYFFSTIIILNKNFNIFIIFQYFSLSFTSGDGIFIDQGNINKFKNIVPFF